jgi:hypothetical protein
VGISVLCLINIRTLRVLSQNSPMKYSDTVTERASTGLLKHPTGVALTPNTVGLNVFVADSGNNVIRWYSSGKLFLTIGSGTKGHVDGPAHSAQFNAPTGIFASANSWFNPQLGHGSVFYHVYVNDSQNQVVRFVCEGLLPNNSPCNAVSTVAGSGVSGFADGQSTQAKFNTPGGLPTRTSSNSPPTQLPFLILDLRNHAVRQWDLTNVTTFAGNGIQGLRNGFRTTAEFNSPTKATWDSNGNIFVADTGNRVIRKIDTQGNVTTFSGSGVVGKADGAATSAQFAMPTSIAYNNGTFYVADMVNNKIRMVTSTGVVSTYAGTGAGGLTNGSRLQATFSAPTDLAILNNLMFIADTNNNAVRVIDMATGTVSTFAN